MMTPKHDNAFGALRLLFASLVIVSHVPELLDGNRDRELLTGLTGTTSFGELAVDGFFIISGYLITASFLNSRSALSYLGKRSARIYPAFIAASLFCLLVAAPLAGARLEHGLDRTVVAAVMRMAVLARPMIAGAFPGQHYGDWTTSLNGAMWTIQYEFACYLIVIAFARLGLLRRPALLLSSAILCLAASRAVPADWMGQLSRPALLPAAPAAGIRLVGMFLTGASFHVLRHRIPFGRAPMLLAAVGLAVTLPIAPIADIGIAVCGGYLMIAGAQLGGSTWLARINNRNDISYGVYLYAWPVQRLFTHLFAVTDPLLLGLLTWTAAIALGWASWLLVERPVMRLIRRRAQESIAPEISDLVHMSPST
ncbi:acyltransferase family protein [uncultured Sphingomonas sp.]|uniref:acyltransferase family protein n=1 Tax=uncultured Sphingomonas sp. TaxID=158754 RepID=UPI0035CAFA35